MKNNFLNKYIIQVLLLACLVITGMSSCEDVNDWGTEDSNRTYSPTTFETSSIGSTSVILGFTSVPNAETYIIEFSHDSLEFNTIVKTLEIPKSALEVDPSTTSGRVKYLLTVDNLDAATQHSARIKVTSSIGLPESKWVEIAFKTRSEQIITSLTGIKEDEATIGWDPANEVTHVVVSSISGERTITLTSDNMAAGQLTVTELSAGTAYTIAIFKGERQRGTISFVTRSETPGDGTKYYLDGTEDIVQYVKALSDEAITLVIPAGASYVIDSTWTLPATLKSLTLWGESEENMPSIKLKSMTINSAVATFSLHIGYMEVLGTDASADYVLNDQATRAISGITIEYCKVHDFRGVVRLRGAISIPKFEFKNSIVYNLGSYGLLCIDDAAVSISEVIVTNSTAYKFTGANVFAFKSVPGSINVDHCTFFDAQTAGRYFANFNSLTPPANFRIKNSLFGSSNATVDVRGVTPKLVTDFVFDSYKTTDYNLNVGYPLTGISDYSKSSNDLFKDPTNGDFTIIDEMIGGEAQPGDPRWWK